jgi:hypothetical protein
MMSPMSMSSAQEPPAKAAVRCPNLSTVQRVAPYPRYCHTTRRQTRGFCSQNNEVTAWLASDMLADIVKWLSDTALTQPAKHKQQDTKNELGSDSLCRPRTIPNTSTTTGVKLKRKSNSSPDSLGF